MKLVQRVKVKNKLGLHTRPAAAIVQMLQTCASDVSFTYRKETVNAKSILSILMLAAGKNSNITITVEGDDAGSTMEQLVTAFDSHFGEKAS